MKCDQRKLRVLLIGVPDTIHVDLLTFPFDTAVVRDQIKNEKSSNILTFDLT